MFRDLISYSRFIAESTDKNKIIERLTNIPESVLACDGHALIWFNSDKIGKILKCKGFNQDVTGIPIHLGKGLVGLCAKNARPILISDTGGRSIVIFSAEENKEKSFLSLMAAPISFNEQLYGVMVCGSKTSGSFSTLKLDSLTLMTYSAGSSIFCAETKERWQHNKNLDQILGLPNHRFLTQHSEALEKELLIKGKSTCFLSLKVKNLHELYSSFGVKNGDLLQRVIASTISSILPSPKYIFKFSENIYIMILVTRKWSEIEPFAVKLENILNNTPSVIEGKTMQACIELGASCFPENGKTFSQLVGTSLHKTTSRLSLKTTGTI